MKQKLIGSIEDVQAQPEKYRRVSETYLREKLIEGLYMVIGTPLFVYYVQETLYLTDNQEEG